MKYGVLELGNAGGTVLAQSVKLQGRRIPKGTYLDAELIENLSKGGFVSVSCVWPDPGDIPENEAAALIADKLFSQQTGQADITVTQPVHARVNFKAACRGIVRYQHEKITAFNLINEGVAFSITAHNQLLEAGDIAATLKIIPYFISASVLDPIHDVLADGPLFSFHPIMPKRAFLIQTTNDLLTQKVYQATEQVTRTRLEKLGCALVGAVCCSDQQDELAASMHMAEQAGAEVLLICAGSAISDAQDKVPATLRALGGEIDQIGLAVDPGNLLMAARRQDMTVIGMPSCARSPKQNGFDLVLQLVLADIPLSRRVLAELGAGGLLTEIASRPAPRAQTGSKGVVEKNAGGMSAILLAAGRSSRMQGQNKLTMQISGKPVVRWAAQAVLAAGFDQLLVVTGHDSIAVQQALSGLPVNYVHNPDYQTGQASSLVCGLEHLPQTDSAVLIALGDMPAMDPEMISALCASHQNTANSFAQITLPTFSAHDDQDKLVRGNPTIWSQPFFEALKRLEGDQGGRQILSDYPAHIQHMHWPDRYVFADVDDPDSFGHVSQYLDKKIRSMGEKK